MLLWHLHYRATLSCCCCCSLMQGMQNLPARPDKKTKNEVQRMKPSETVIFSITSHSCPYCSPWPHQWQGRHLQQSLGNVLRHSHICSELSKRVITSLRELSYHDRERERVSKMNCKKRLERTPCCVVPLISLCVAEGGAWNWHVGSDKVMLGGNKTASLKPALELPLIRPETDARVVARWKIICKEEAASLENVVMLWKYSGHI